MFADKEQVRKKAQERDDMWNIRSHLLIKPHDYATYHAGQGTDPPSSSLTLRYGSVSCAAVGNNKVRQVDYCGYHFVY